MRNTHSLLRRRTAPTLILAALIVAALAHTAHAFDVVLGSTLGGTVTASPGASVTQTIILNNTTAEVQSVRLSVRDTAVGPDGTGVGRSMRDWVTFAQGDVVELPPRSVQQLEYTITVPSDASGSYWSRISVNPTGTVALSDVELTDDARLNVRTGVEYAGRLFVDVAGTGFVDLQLGRPHIDTTASSAALRHTITNTGNRIARADVRWDVIDLSSGDVVASGARSRVVYPDVPLTLEHDLGALRPGTYEIVIIADALEWSVFMRQETITVD